MGNRRRLRGCLFGCLGSAIAIMVIMGLTSFWLVKKGTYEPPETMLFPDTDFYLHSELKREDDVLLEFLVTQIQAMNSEQFRELEKAIPFLGGQMGEKKTRRDVKKILPMQIDVSGNLAEDDLVFAVGFSLYNNMARLGFWFFKRAVKKDPKAIYKEVNGKAYIKPNSSNDFFIALENSVFYLAKSEDAMIRVLTAAKQDQEKHETHPSLINVQQDATLWGVMRGDSLGKFASLLTENADVTLQTSSEGILLGSSVMRAMAYDMRVENAETLKLQLYCDVNPTSPELEQQVDQLLEHIITEAKVKVEKSIEMQETGMIITLILSEFDRIKSADL